VAFDGPGDEREDAYTSALLGKFPILIRQARQRTMPMACSFYIGCDLALLLSGGWWGEQKSSKLQNGHFCRVLSLILT
jgi:hypothetical protein